MKKRKIGKYIVTEIPCYVKLSDEQKRILGFGRKPLPRTITPEQAILEQKVREFDALPNCQAICDRMKVYILDGIEDLEAIDKIFSEFGIDKDFLNYFYPKAKKNVLDKKSLGML